MKQWISIATMVIWGCSAGQSGADKTVLASDSTFFIRGTGLTQGDSIVLEWPGSGISFSTSATSVSVLMTDVSHGSDDYGNPQNGYYGVLENGTLIRTIQGHPDQDVYELEDLSPGFKELSVIRLNEPMVSHTIFKGIRIQSDFQVRRAKPAEGLKLLMIGNSITTGYGNRAEADPCHFSASTQDFSYSYIYKAATAMNAVLSVRAWSGKGLVKNYDRSTSATMRHLYLYALPFTRMGGMAGKGYDIALIHLGTNDFAHEVPDQEAWVTAYNDLITELNRKHGVSKFLLLGGPTMQDRENMPAWSMLKSSLNKVAQRVSKKGLQAFTLFFTDIKGARSGCDAHPGSGAHEEMALILEERIKTLWPPETIEG